MRLHAPLKIGNQNYAAGAEIPWTRVYPFFMVHMLMFGGSGFLMAYASKAAPVGFLYAHGGIAILVYTVFYLAIFGRDEVRWMFINAGLGVLGIYSQIGWVLALFGKEIGDYPLYVHVIPFLYFVLYTFLLRHALLDITGARRDEIVKKRVEYGYVGGSLLFYLASYALA
jgi:hypothetical protein